MNKGEAKNHFDELSVDISLEPARLSWGGSVRAAVSSGSDLGLAFCLDFI